MIKKKRVRNIKSYLSGVKPGTAITIGVNNIGRFEARLQEIGFSTALAEGETVLSAVIGPVTRFNAEGDFEVKRDEPMETVYRTVEWSWTEWHGPHEVHKTDFRDLPYQRYPRIFIPPPSVELSIGVKASGEKVVIAPALTYDETSEKLLLHTVNLFLEIFGECDFFSPDGGFEEIVYPEFRIANSRANARVGR